MINSCSGSCCIFQFINYLTTKKLSTTMPSVRQNNLHFFKVSKVIASLNMHSQENKMLDISYTGIEQTDHGDIEGKEECALIRVIARSLQ